LKQISVQISEVETVKNKILIKPELFSKDYIVTGDGSLTHLLL